jgi:endonuclease YncB( thermonuclease family)
MFNCKKKLEECKFVARENLRFFLILQEKAVNCQLLPEKDKWLTDSAGES